MLTPIKAVGFDLDGTLVDSLPGLATAIDALLQSLGRPPATQERVVTWIGNGMPILVNRALQWAEITPATPTEFDQYLALFQKYYQQHMISGTLLYPEVKNSLEQIAKNHYPMVLITNKAQAFLVELLQSLEIDQYFQFVIGGDRLPQAKPHPAPIYLALAELGITAQEFLFVGDSRNDILAAKAAGCHSAGLTYGYNYDEPLAHSEPDSLFDHFGALLTLLP